LTITRTMAVGMDAPALDGWTPTRIPGRGPPPRADTLADGRRGRPHRRTGSFVIRAPRPTRRDGRLQTTRGRASRGRASGHGVGRGGRPSWCPLAPSSRPSKVSILDGGPGGCPAVGSGASIPTACRAWKVQENSMSGRWRSARRRLAPTTRPCRLSAATSRSCSRPSRTHLQRVYQRVYHERLGTFLHSGQPRRPVPRRAAGVLPGRV
jgi:hypothetical protein